MPPKRKASAAAAATTTSTAPTTTTTSRPKRGAAKVAAAKNAAQVPDDEDEDDDKPPPAKKAKVSTKASTTDADDKDEKKMATVLKRGAVPVDPLSGYVQTHQVLTQDGEIWDAMLNQTNVNHNNNKFYVIQLVHPVAQPSQVSLFTRWGRVGDNGQKQTKGPYSVAAGISAFKNQFKSKAGANWEARHNMTAKSGKYVWIERDYEEEKQDEGTKKGKEKAGDDAEEEDIIPDCTLHPQVMALCQIIFSSKLMDATLSAMNYDAKKAPLGKLSKATILRGFGTLKKLAEVLDDATCATALEYADQRTAYSELTNAYYSLIPHDFGRRRPTIIDSKELLKKELELVDALGDMEVASKLISTTNHTDATGNPINQFDFYFNSLDLLSMDPIEKKTKEFESLEMYTHGTHGKTHHFNCQVEAAFRVERRGEADRWAKGKYDELPAGDRLLLWHGSRATNFAGILKQGLRIAPPEAPVSGYMFGKGVYFADMMSKSAGYTCHYLSNNTALLLLCEVAAKPCHELKQADYNAEQGCRNNGKLATKGLGGTAPVEWQDAGEALEHEELKGCHMPKGGAVDNPIAGASLYYNEYIVYSVDQIRLRYLIQLKMG